MECRMDGRTAIVTGGSLGLGKAMAMEFAKSGANVAIVARRAEFLEEAKGEIQAAAPGAKVEAYPCDLRDPAAIKAMHAIFVGDLGPADIVVNNAGTSRGMDFMDITALLGGAWDQINHEHVCYHGLATIMGAANLAGLDVVRAQRHEANGGVMRVLCQKPGGPLKKAVDFDTVWNEEKIMGSRWGALLDRVTDSTDAIRKFVETDDTVEVLGASQRGNTVLRGF